MNEAPHHAIVYGASGLIGWAVVDQLLRSYPDAAAFSKVTAVTNRPVDLAESHWPKVGAETGRPDLQLVSGIDLRRNNGVELASSLEKVVHDISTVTHIFYLVFVSVPDDIEEVAVNRRMLQSVIDAHAQLSPELKFVAFAGGTRGYGIYAPGGSFTPPLTEDLVNKLPPDYVKTVVYPAYRELLDAASEGKDWTWCEVCPDAIVGFTPNGSQFSLALHWAQYLSLYAYNHGIGPSTQPDSNSDSAAAVVKVPFPGSPAGAKSLFSPVSASRLARFMIFASLRPATCGGGRLFNVADRAKPCTYGELWPKLAAWFGLVGEGEEKEEVHQKEDTPRLAVGELPSISREVLLPGVYVEKYAADVFVKNGCARAVDGGVGAGRKQLDSVGYWLTFDRQLSLERMQETGFEADVDPAMSWIESFRMFREAGLIL